jgi:hypothetical protein
MPVRSLCSFTLYKVEGGVGRVEEEEEGGRDKKIAGCTDGWAKQEDTR